MKILVTGSTGFLGQAVCRSVAPAHRVTSVWQGGGRKDAVDLRQPDHMRTLLEWAVPDVVIHCAYPGTDGIATALTGMADLVHDQLLIDLQVIDACARARVSRLICVGSVCAYPQHVSYPTTEDALWAGMPELLNGPYGEAKRMQIQLLHAYRRQYGLESTHLILGNLYGPGDRSGHVIPATIRKCLHARDQQQPEILVWGSGKATREFTYVDDAAAAVVKAALAPTTLAAPVNIVSGEEVSIASLVNYVKQLTGCTSATRWDATKPDGQPRRLFSNAKAKLQLGWVPTTPFLQGLAQTVQWQEAQQDVHAS